MKSRYVTCALLLIVLPSALSAAQDANSSLLPQLDASEAYYQYIGYLEPTAPRYLTLIFDCSELDFAVNQMPALWDHPTRGTLPLGWALPAPLAQAAPALLHRCYADAYRFGMDQFVLGSTAASQLDPWPGRLSLDIHTYLYRTPTSPDDLARFAAETGARGIFLLDSPDFEPLLLDGVPVLPAPRIASLEAAVTYLDRIPLARRYAALCLDPHKLDPADAAHIAAHVSHRFLLVPPEELIQLLRRSVLPPQPDPSAAAVTAVTYPDPSPPDAPIPIKATITAPRGLASVYLIYQPANRPLAFSEPMSPTQEGYAAQLPPLRCGGDFLLRVRACDQAGRVAWSPPWTLHVLRTDADNDGLSDAEEHFLLTDPNNPDTDADGLRDASDPTPLHPDHVSTTYFGPLLPPSDLPYLPDPGASRADPEGRHLDPGQTCLYWLPLTRQPQAGAPAVIALDAQGPAALAIAADPGSLVNQFLGDLTDIWYSQPLPPEARNAGVFLRITCPENASLSLLIRGLALLSPPDSPSIARASCRPAHPGPEQPMLISALIFSPKGIAAAALTYRINEGGTITIPMVESDSSQYYQARIPPLENQDRLEWWITARDHEGHQAATTPSFLPIGGRARELVSLLARREFLGEWAPAPDWEGAARLAPSPGLRDFAYVNLTGGLYTVWILAGGRGQSIALYVGDKKVGSLDPRRPDGWHQLGRLRLDAGRHQVRLVSLPAGRQAGLAGADAPPGAAPRYAAVIFSADPTFHPPADQVLDSYNSILLLFPPPNQALTGRVELLATGAGNLTAANFSLDGQLLDRVPGPPFHLSINTARLPNGPHTLRVEAVDRAGPTGLAMEVPITIAN